MWKSSCYNVWLEELYQMQNITIYMLTSWEWMPIIYIVSVVDFLQSDIEIPIYNRLQASDHVQQGDICKILGNEVKHCSSRFQLLVSLVQIQWFTDHTSFTNSFLVSQELVRKGIPHHFRGLAWQLLLGVNDSQFKQLYAEYLKKTSPCEKLIRRDIARTFPDHDFFKEKDGLGQESLFNVMKVRRWTYLLCARQYIDW